MEFIFTSYQPLYLHPYPTSLFYIDLALYLDYSLGRRLIVLLIRNYKEGHLFFASFLFGVKRNEE